MLIFFVIALVVGLLIYLANKGRKADISEGIDREDTSYLNYNVIGPVLLVGGVLAALFFLQINPVIQSNYGAEYHPEVASRQQSLLFISGLSALIGAIITFRKKT